MRKKIIPEEEIINLSKATIQDFYNRDVEHAVERLGDDFMWIGAFDFQYTVNRNQFLEVIRSELNAPPFKMLDEEFMLVSKSATCYVVCAKFRLVAQTEDNFINFHTRLTMVWKYYKDKLKLCHVHGSNAQDIPVCLEEEMSKTEYKPDHNDDFFAYIDSLNLKNTENKLAFRDLKGKHRYFLESEVVYLQANMQSTLVHTSNECIETSGILLNNAKKLPKQFFRIHKSYVVNVTLVQTIERYTVTLTNDVQLPISKEKYIEFREYCKNYRQQ